MIHIIRYIFFTKKGKFIGLIYFFWIFKTFNYIKSYIVKMFKTIK